MSVKTGDFCPFLISAGFLSAIHRHFVGDEFLWHSCRAGHAPCLQKNFMVVAKAVRKKDSEQKIEK